MTTLTVSQNAGQNIPGSINSIGSAQRGAKPSSFAPWSLTVPDQTSAKVTQNPIRPARLDEETRFALRMRDSNAQAVTQKSQDTEIAQAKESSAQDEESQFGSDGFGFDDFLDIINPLQHIPLVNTAYRALTGDEIEPGSRLIGGAIFGGPLGFAGALANNIVEDQSGRDIGDHVLAFFAGGEGEDGNAGTTTPDSELALARGPNQTAERFQAAGTINPVNTEALGAPAVNNPQNPLQGFAASELSPARLTDVFFDEDDPTTPFSRAAQQDTRNAARLSDETIFSAPPEHITQQTGNRRRVAPETAARLSALAEAQAGPGPAPEQSVLSAASSSPAGASSVASSLTGQGFVENAKPVAETTEDNPFRRFERRATTEGRIDVADSPLAKQAIQIAAQNAAIQQAQTLSHAGAARAYAGAINPASQLPAAARQNIPDSFDLNSFDMSSMGGATPAAAGADLRLQMAGLTGAGPLSDPLAASQAAIRATNQAAGEYEQAQSNSQMLTQPSMANPVAKEAIPEAMLSALERYNVLKANSG